jgi:hypothetical protein
MALIGRIRGMRMRDGKSISEISRLTGLSRNMNKRWLNVAQGATPKYRRRDVSTKLAPFIATLTQGLEVDARRAKHERRTLRALHVQLASQGYDGRYTRLIDFIRQWRDKQGKFISARGLVPLAFELGEAFQFDWSEEAQTTPLYPCSRYSAADILVVDARLPSAPNLAAGTCNSRCSVRCPLRFKEPAICS